MRPETWSKHLVTAMSGHVGKCLLFAYFNPLSSCTYLRRPVQHGLYFENFWNLPTALDANAIAATFFKWNYTCVFHFFSVLTNHFFYLLAVFFAACDVFPKFAFHECFWKFIAHSEASKNMISCHIKWDLEPDTSIAPSTRNSCFVIVYFRLWLSKQTCLK